MAVSNRVWTVPNLLSAIRLLLVPVFLGFIVTNRLALAVLTLAVSSLTDFADGFIARRFHQVTRLGQLLDPAADRLFILATLLGIAILGVVPWWFLALIVARDVMLIVLGFVLANHDYGPLPVHHLGKMATFCLLFGFPSLLLGASFPQLAWWATPLGWAAAVWGGFLYWWAGGIYLVETARLLRREGATSQSRSDMVER